MSSRAFSAGAVFLLLILCLVACAGVSEVGGQATPEAVSTPTVAASAAATTAPTSTPLFGEFVETRMPEPTVTPGPVARAVESMVTRVGLAWTRVLGLTIPEWVTVGTSLLSVLVAYLFGTLLIRRVLPALARRTSGELDDLLLEGVGSHLRWLVVFITSDLVVRSWSFLSAEFKQLLHNLDDLAIHSVQPIVIQGRRVFHYSILRGWRGLFFRQSRDYNGFVRSLFHGR
jgi:hypothetical protein